MHWYMACINFKEKRTEVYDSMGDGRRQAVHANLMRWLKDEHQDKVVLPPPALRRCPALPALLACVAPSSHIVLFFWR